MSQIPYYELKNAPGMKMPAIGLGCYSGRSKEQRDAGKEWMLTALKNGYRHLDTAYLYGTEHVVGQAIRESGIPREEIFVTTKLPLHHQGRVRESLEESLKNLGYDYLDLYLIHWPQAFAYTGPDQDIFAPGTIYEALDHPTINETWAEMEKLLESGKVKAIGVSNYSVKTLTQLLETAKVPPAVNQVEIHPYFSQNELKTFCDSKGIHLTAYSPTGYASVSKDPEVVALAEKYGVSPVQVTLAWHLSRGISAIPSSSNPERQQANIRLPKLDDQDIRTLNSLNKNMRLCPFPVPQNNRILGWTYEQLGWQPPVTLDK